MYLQLICSDLREDTEGGWEKLERDVEEQVEEELGRFLLSLLHGDDGPGDGSVVEDFVSDSKYLLPEIQDLIPHDHITMGSIIRIIFSP